MKRLLRRLLRVAAIGCVALVAVVTVVLVDAWEGFGAAAKGERLARMERSPQWKDGGFHNPQPLVNDELGSLTGWFSASAHASPEQGALAVERVDPKLFQSPPSTGLRVTWFGHASTLVEIDGARVLTDPMWSERSSPLEWVGPRRWYPPPVELEALPAPDAVVISHDHYDHLDAGTVQRMKAWPTRFIVPLGLGAHLEEWGIPADRITELDWWEQTRVGTIDVVATPARHASGRALWDMDSKLWAGWALVGEKHRVYFSGDTGLFPAMKDIGEKLGPFDVTMIETGQYHRAWPDWHIGPEQAVQAHQMVKGKVMLPVHWALLTLAYHGWTEPMERVLTAAKDAGVEVITPRPGQSVEPGAVQVADRWWPNVPWETAAQHPIVSAGMH